MENAKIADIADYEKQIADILGSVDELKKTISDLKVYINKQNKIIDDLQRELLDAYVSRLQTSLDIGLRSRLRV